MSKCRGRVNHRNAGSQGKVTERQSRPHGDQSLLIPEYKIETRQLVSLFVVEVVRKIKIPKDNNIIP